MHLCHQHAWSACLPSPLASGVPTHTRRGGAVVRLVRVGMASHVAPTAGRVLAGMRPYTVVTAISRVGGRSYGLALSDPYLSHATPLCTVPVSGGTHARAC